MLGTVLNPGGEPTPVSVSRVGVRKQVRTRNLKERLLPSRLVTPAEAFGRSHTITEKARLRRNFLDGLTCRHGRIY